MTINNKNKNIMTRAQNMIMQTIAKNCQVNDRNSQGRSRGRLSEVLSEIIKHNYLSF